MVNSPRKMSLILFDDIFFVFLEGSNTFSEHKIFELDDYCQQVDEGESGIDCFLSSPYILIPELAHQDGSEVLLMQASHPYLTTRSTRYTVDTWAGKYCKLVYYIPNLLFKPGFNKKHWLSCLSAYNQAFFDQWHTACWAYKLANKLFIFISVEKSLKEVKVYSVLSPDDSTYFLLKLLERYKIHQNEMVVWTNEPGEHHLHILKKFVPKVIYSKSSQAELIHEILDASCES